MAKKASRVIDYATSRVLWRIDYHVDYVTHESKDVRVAASNIMDALDVFRKYFSLNKDGYNKSDNKFYVITKVTEQPENRVILMRSIVE